MIGVLIFVALGAKFVSGGNTGRTSTAITPTPAVVATAQVQARDTALSGWCELNGTLIPPGEHQVGSEMRRCLEGIWFTDAEDAP